MNTKRTHPGTTKHNSAGNIKDVANAAGVSIATVSRAFNRPDTVKQKTCDLVFEIASKLNYVPDSAARALVSQENRRIGALIPTINDSIFTHFVGALQQRLSKDGYTLLIGVYDFDPDYEAKELRSLIESGVDGVVLCGGQRPFGLYDLLQQRSIPFITSNIYTPESPYPSVGPDFHACGVEVANHLVNLGHQNIGFIDLSPSKNDRAALRLSGVLQALKQGSLKLPSSNYVERPLSIEDGRIGLRTLLEHSPDTTAVICGNDVHAIGAIFEATDAGISIPDELSIIGFDNLELSAQIKPGLTTVNLPTSTMGIRVAEDLLLTLAGKPTPHATRLESNLVIRGSTGPCRTNKTHLTEMSDQLLERS